MARRIFTLALALIALAGFSRASGAGTLTFAHTFVSQQTSTGEPGLILDPRTAPATIYAVGPTSHTAVWSSTDGGLSFNQQPDSLGASGDSDVAVDADGVLYVSDLFEKLPVSTSYDGGATYARVVQAQSSGDSIDRQWIVASGHGHVVVSISDLTLGQYVAYVSDDAAQTFSGPYTIASNIGLGGPMTIAPDGSIWTLYTNNGMNYARSTDGGLTWSTGWIGWVAFSHLKSSLNDATIFPVVDVDAGGTAYATWSAPAPGSTSINQAIYVTQSSDGGQTWAPQEIISDTSKTAVMPWVVAGAAGKVDVAYYQSSDTLPSDAGEAVTTWNVMLGQSLDATQPDHTWNTAIATEKFHSGSICTNGTGCIGPQSFGVGNFPGPFDRRPLDFFELDIDPVSGMAVLVHPQDRPLTPTGARNGRMDIVLDRQTGGSGILS